MTYSLSALSLALSEMPKALTLQRADAPQEERAALDAAVHSAVRELAVEVGDAEQVSVLRWMCCLGERVCTYAFMHVSVAVQSAVQEMAEEVGDAEQVSVLGWVCARNLMHVSVAMLCVCPLCIACVCPLSMHHWPCTAQRQLVVRVGYAEQVCRVSLKSSKVMPDFTVVKAGGRCLNHSRQGQVHMA